MKRRRPLETVFLVALVLLALAARLIPGPRTVDDAYITFRYAHNLVEGRGLVYNPGERVLGTTTPLYAALLAALAWLSGWRDFPLLALGVNALAGAASVLLLYALGRRLSTRPVIGAAAATAWAVAPFSVSFAVGGMETDLTIALLLGAFLAHVCRRDRVTAVCAALAFLARPDTLIATAPLALDLWLDGLRGQKRRLFPWPEAAIALALLAPWLIFATLYYGSPLPASLAAKSAAYRLPPTADLVRLIQHYSTPFLEHEVLGRTWQLVGAAVYLALCLIGGGRILRRERRAWPVLIYPYAYFAVFAVANPLLFRWYLSPPLPVYMLLIFEGAWTLAHDLSGLLARLRPGHPAAAVPRALFALLLCATLASTLNAWTLHPDHGPDRPAPEMAWFELELLYAQAADVVRAQAAEGDTLCAGDIGVLGYRSGMTILDTVGLVTPASSAYYPADPAIYVINYAIPADLVLALDPDYIVILEVYGRLGLLPDARFQARYQLLERLEADIYGSDGMLILARRQR